MVQKNYESIEPVLHRDEFLSSYFLPEGAYRYTPPFEAPLPNAFIYSKIACGDLKSLEYLLQKGFKLIETTLLFEQKTHEAYKQKTGFTCRDAHITDKEHIGLIAQEAFHTSRFHKDDAIPKETSSRIKKDWAENFFAARRGTRMIVCTESNSESSAEKGKEPHILGFLLLMDEVIDLIAVSHHSLKRGIASNLIGFANTAQGCLKAGTQACNAASISLYQKMGFSLLAHSFTLHKHPK
jgi:hypothetical protein